MDCLVADQQTMISLSKEMVSERQMGSICASMATELMSIPKKLVVVASFVTFLGLTGKAKFLTHNDHGRDVVGTHQGVWGPTVK